MSDYAVNSRKEGAAATRFERIALRGVRLRLLVRQSPGRGFGYAPVSEVQLGHFGSGERRIRHQAGIGEDYGDNLGGG